MKKNPTFLAVVPARAGSKGISGKNTRLFCGKPLMAHTIEAAKGCSRIDRVILSTDSEQYARIGRRYGAEVPFLRPKRLAADTSKVIDAFIHLLDWLKRTEEYVPDYVINLQTTSPLRTREDLDRCIDLVLEKNCDGILSFCSTEQLLYTVDGRGMAKLLFNKSWLSSTNRQSLPDAYKLNGAAVYIMKTTTLLRNRSFLEGRIAAYIMPKWQSPDLDNEEDFHLAELIYKNREKFNV